MGVTGHCAKGYSFCSRVSLPLAMMPRTEPMAEQKRKRISSRRLVCAITVLAIVAAPLYGFCCTGGAWLARGSQATTECSGMGMSHEITSVETHSPLGCCQITHGLPVTVGMRTTVETTRTQILPVVVATEHPGLFRTERAVPRPVESSPPQNMQSLLCTLLL